MWSPSQSAGALLWGFLITLRWAHAQFLQPAADWCLDTALPAWEESVKALIRETFAVATHALNSASGAALSLFSLRSYSRTVRGAGGREGSTTASAWRSYWESASGTFNAVLEREGLSLPAVLSRASSSQASTPRAAPAGPSPALHTAAAAVAAASLPKQRQQAKRGAGLLSRARSWWRRRRGVAAPGPALDGSGAGQGRGPGQAHSRENLLGEEQGPRRKGTRRKGGPDAKKGVAAKRTREMSTGDRLFELPSGFAVSEGAERRGLVEEARVAAEVGVSRAFGAVRRGVRRLLWLDGSNRLPSDLVASRLEAAPPLAQQMSRRGSRGGAAGLLHGEQPDGGQAVEGLHVWTASDVILRAGYPLEEHSVTTPDGYVLQMHRICRPGARDVAFFQHGVLDTSLGWVANGSVGSQAFAAYDAGFDVWLANSRSNAPRLHLDPKRRGSRYWYYSSNEMALMDIGAQIDHLHSVKLREILMQRGSTAAGARGGSRVQERAQHAAPAAEGGTAAALSASMGTGESLAAAAGPHPRLWRSASAPLLDQSGWGLGGEQALLGGSTAAPLLQPRSSSPLGVLGGPDGEVPAGLVERSADTSGRAHNDGGSGQALRAQEHQIGAAAEGEGAEDAGSTLSMAASLARLFSAGSGAAPSGGGEGPAGRAPARSPSEALRQQQQQADEKGALGSLRRTQSCGAILGLAAAQEGAPALSSARGRQRSRRSNLGAAVAGGSGTPAAAAPSSGFGVPSFDGPPSAAEPAPPGSPMSIGLESPSLPPSPSPIRVSGGSRSHSRDAALSSQRRSSPGTPPDWASIGSSGGEGYATPHSTGYDTPRSGYDTPHSERSGLSSGGGREADVTPYRLQVVGHSLGAACVLMYAVGRRMAGQPHRIRRIVLMSPAGFHSHVPISLRPFKYLLPAAVRLLRLIRPGVGVGLRLPSPLLRFAVFKLTMDLQHIPALNELVRAAMRLLLSGDSSQWDRAMQMPHYNTYSMPALSLHCGAHFAQWSRDPRFRLFDYGSAAANREHYGSDTPPSIADHYHLLAPVPVDLIAGRFDGIIDCQDVYQHYQRMKEAGVVVTYRELDFGHMDFTFAVKDEIRHYVLSRLQRPIL